MKTYVGIANAVPDSRTPRRFIAVSSSDRDDRDRDLVALASDGDRRRGVLRGRRDRHGDGEHVVDQQRAGHGQAGGRAEVDGGDLVVAAAGRVGVHVLPVGRDHHEHDHRDGEADLPGDTSSAARPAIDSVRKISSGA